MEDVAWYPLVYELSSPPDGAKMAGPVLSNSGSGEFQVLYRLPIPTMKGNRRLHIDGAQLGVYSADPMNHVVKFNVVGVTINDVEKLCKIHEPVTMKMIKTQKFTAVDVSQYEAVFIRIWIKTAEPQKMAITAAMLHCYYV
ncbi:MAG: hypothetical protein ACTSUZ_00610 [Candidatus Thorarchaeota archaeon]